MNELERVKKEAESVRLSLEALSLARKEKPPPRPLPEIVKDYAANPVKLSPELVERLRYLAP